MLHQSVGRELPIQDNQAASGTGCLLRLLWMGVGNLLLVGFAAVILQRGAFSGWDVAYWATVVAVVAVRYVDIAHYGGTTADNRHATAKDFTRYVLALGAVTFVVWGACHLVGPRL